MRKKFICSVLLAGFMVGWIVPRVAATSASISTVSSNSTVTNGNNVTITVRVSSGGNLMDSAQATLNFDSSKLQYQSHAGGAFSPIVQSPSGSSFSFAGAILGGSTSGTQNIFSVTFKTTAAGTASFSISGAQVAYAGSALSITSASGTGISIQNPTTSSPLPSTSSPSSPRSPRSSSSPTSVSQPVEAKDTQAPSITPEPSFISEPGVIKGSIKTDEPSRLVVLYGLPGGEFSEIRLDELRSAHDFIIGAEQSLRAGRVYQIKIVATDEAGNESSEIIYEARSLGVRFRVAIIDSRGKPLRNYPVTLFSDPIESNTDENGVVTFDDVTPGEHTVVFELDGVTIRQPVLVGESLALTDTENTNGELTTVTLPFVLQEGVSTGEAQQQSILKTVAVAVMSGIVVTLLVQKMLNEKWLQKLYAQMRMKFRVTKQ